MICMHGPRTLRKAPGHRRGISVANRLLTVNATCNALTIRTHFGIFRVILNQQYKSFLYYTVLLTELGMLDFVTRDVQVNLSFLFFPPFKSLSFLL